MVKIQVNYRKSFEKNMKKMHLFSKKNLIEIHQIPNFGNDTYRCPYKNQLLFQSRAHRAPPCSVFLN